MTHGSELHEAFIEAYPRYVATTLHGAGVEVDELVADAIIEGVTVLDRLLSQLESTPSVGQTAGPLELFAEALRPVSRALDTAGVEPRTPGRVLALYPWDTHGLVPGSSNVLGERAHTAHLAWGVTKAQAVGAFGSGRDGTRPGVLVLCRAQDADRIGVAVDHAGYRWVDRPDAGGVVALVDVSIAGAATAIAEAVTADHRVIAFGEIDDLQRVGILAAGAWKTATREQILDNLEALLPTIV